MSTRPLRKRLPELVIGALCAALVAAGAAQAVTSDGDGPSAMPSAVPSASPTQTPTPTPPPTPAPAVLTPAPAPRPTTPTQVYAALSAFAAVERGLGFTRPVRPQYVSGRAFDAALVRIGRTPPAARRVPTDAAYRARRATLFDLRLARSTKEVDQYYAKAGRFTDLRAAYDPRTGRLLVRGGTLTPFVQQEVVRELTLVLQAQHFRLRPSGGEDGARALRALRSGDASRVARAWYDEQPLAVRQRIDRDAFQLYGDAGGSPDALSVLDSYPDLAGPGLVKQLLRLGGQARLDAAFRRPPTTTAQVRDARLLAPKPVSVPALPRGARRLEVGALGEVGLALLLQEYPTAPAAARGWRGDRFLTYAVGGRTCTLMQVRTGSPAQQRALVAAAKRVVGAVRPLGSTGVALRGCR